MSTEYIFEWFMQRSAESAAKVEKLRELFPGCFDEHGNPIVATAHLPLKENQ